MRTSIYFHEPKHAYHNVSAHTASVRIENEDSGITIFFDTEEQAEKVARAINEALGRK